VSKSEAAALLYLEFRNPLVHELAQDKKSKTRRGGFEEPIVGKWGVPKAAADIDAIDSLAVWNDDWPTIAAQKGPKSRMKLSDAALYWSTKALIKWLLQDWDVIEAAETTQLRMGRGA
jgi:hypothetical protein